MGSFDGSGAFPRVDRRAVAAGTPGDVFASALLRGQEYWLARQGCAFSGPRAMQEQARYASYEWRVLRWGRFDLRPGLKRLEAPIDLDVSYDGTGTASPLEWRLRIIGMGEGTSEMTIGDGVRSVVMEFDDAIPEGLNNAVVVLEFRSDVAGIKPVVDPSTASGEVRATWTEHGEIWADTGDDEAAGLPPSPKPSQPNHVFISGSIVDSAIEYDNVIELSGPDQRISVPDRFRYPTTKKGGGDELLLWMGYLTYFELRSVSLTATHEPLAGGPEFIAYPLTRMTPQTNFRGEETSLHGHNATGLYARASQWRAWGLPGAVHVDDAAENVARTRWTALRTQKLGVAQSATYDQIVDMNGTSPRIDVSLSLLAFFLPLAGTPRFPAPDSIDHAVTITVKLRQYVSGTVSTVLDAVTIVRPLAFHNTRAASRPDIVQQFAQTFRGSDLGVNQNVNWRDGLATLDDLLLGEWIDVQLDGSGIDPDVPVIIEVEAEQENAIQGTDISAWVVCTQSSIACTRQPFDDGAPSAAHERMATSYQGFAPLDTARGRVINAEAWEVWPDLNHLTWSQGGSCAQGIGSAVLDNAAFEQLGEIERMAALFMPVLDLNGQWKLRVAMYASEVEVRISHQTSPGGAITTTLLTQSGATPAWAEAIITYTSAINQRITIEARTTGSEGRLYCLAPREPQAAEGDL